ncbi:MAG: hypothetical protein GY853_13670 [PVC group bacterium]|nr:hypothetical protein [PVC group bacterium]
MYIQEGKKISKSTIKKAIVKRITDWNNRAAPKSKRIYLDEYEMKHAIDDIYNLNVALLKGHDVYAVCDKEPRGNLDSGNHYFSVFYVKNNQSVCFWCNDLMRAFCCKENKNGSGLRKWTFYSGAIGMSRILDATDPLFNFLKSMGGCYAQIDWR